MAKANKCDNPKCETLFDQSLYHLVKTGYNGTVDMPGINFYNLRKESRYNNIFINNSEYCPTCMNNILKTVGLDYEVVLKTPNDGAK